MTSTINNFFAFDVGATSGQSILGTINDGKLKLREFTRFPNKIYRLNKKYYWNIYTMYEELKKV